MVRKLLLISLTLISSVSYAAQLVTHEEAKKMNLVKIETVSVGPKNGAVSSPTDVHKILSDKADEKGGRYYEIISGREKGPNFVATAIVYK
ncbi:DUF1471 domain-containing protein [Salmonella enterica subsp. enterica serovar Typhimurium]|nr:DUF1471 domain-containing protein [Salmonella enterica subsp. enterica serovar Typhimurium]